VPTFLIQLAYTPDAWAAMVNQPQNRLEAVRPVVEKLGGKFEHARLAFGEYDIVGVVETPENTDAAAFAMAIAAGGAAKTFKTTPLLSVEEGIEAMSRGRGIAGPADSDAGYRESRRGHRQARWRADSSRACRRPPGPTGAAS